MMKPAGFSLLAMLACGWAAAPLAAQVPPPPTITRTAPASRPQQTLAPVTASPVSPFTVTHYDLALTFNFPQHQLEAVAKLTLVPNTPISSATFQLNQNLRLDSVTDAAGNNLGSGRQLENVIVTLNGPQAAGSPVDLTFHYAGALASAALSPIPGIRTAYVGPEGAFLLYPGDWFPVADYNTGRFTASVHATLPASMAMIASGTPSSTPGPNGTVTYQFQQTHASFPGTVIVTPLKPQDFTQQDFTSHFYFSPDVPTALTQKYAAAAAQVYTFMADTFGTPPLQHLDFVELPADAMPSFSSPGIIVLSKSSIGAAVNPNLLVDEIAQQWFGIMVSPASLDDSWLQFGAARFAESLYVEQTQGKAAWKDLVTELEIGALSYPDTALSESSQLYVFSPQFQDLNYDKGAMLFHMLRWVIGDQPFNNALRSFVNTYAWKPVSTLQFEQFLEKQTNENLQGFFSQWYQGTSIPSFTNEYTVYRLQKGGYRVTGKIQQKLDLFNMPVQLAVETDGATETRTVQVSGSDSSFSVNTTGRPLKVTVDPNNWILKSDSELNLRVDLALGDNLVAAGDFPNAIKQYQAALKLNPISSLAQYRLAEAYFQEQNWQNAADAYRQAMNGDQNPTWVVVWSHIQLGKIFDLTGQRDRALNEYQQALATHDDTNGALELARQYMQAPYKAAAGAQ